MNTHSPPVEGGGLRSVLDLSMAVKRGTETIRRHYREGNISASKVGATIVFYPHQWDAAISFFAALDRREVTRNGAH